MSGQQQVACRECRQQKVKCSGKSGSGEACERCAKRDLECIIDNNYKRTVKRKAVELLEAEVAELKQRLSMLNGNSEREPSSNSAEKSLSSPTANDEPHHQPRRIKTTHLMPASFTPPGVISIAPYPTEPQVDSWTCAPKTTVYNSQEPLTLDSMSIELLFKEYVTHYHRVLPVVEVSRGPEFVYKASTALFWTVMAIGSRRRSVDLPEGVTFERLCQAQEVHLGQAAVSPILGHGKSSEFNLASLYAVQAFLLCTLWPPPTASINADMSWTTSGIAVLTAIRAGLHCPGHASDFERIFRNNTEHRTNLSEQLVTWLATNALSQAIANMFGYPSAAKFKAHRQFLFHNIELPPRVRHMYEIQRIANDIEKSLGQLGQGDATIDSTMTTSLIRIHAARYDQLEADFGSSMDAWTLFTLHAGRAQLFSYYMFCEIKEEGVLALYNACLALLNHVSMQNDEYMRYLPVVSIMILWQSASVVVRLWHSKWSANLDKETGELLYRNIIKKVMLSSIFEHDLPYRAAEIMTQMWATFSAMRRANHHRAVSATLTLRSRMTASVFFDSLWTMREGAEIRSHAPTKLTRSSIHRNTPSNVAKRSNYSAASSRVPADKTSPDSNHGNSAPNNLSRAQATTQTPPSPTASMRGNAAHNEVPELVASPAPAAQRAHPIVPPPPPGTHVVTNPHLPPHSAPRQNGAPNGISNIPRQLNQPLPQHQQIALSEPSWETTRGSFLSPDSGSTHRSDTSPVSPALSAMIDGSWAEMDSEAASAIWRDVDTVMEDFGFGLGELPYISP